MITASARSAIADELWAAQRDRVAIAPIVGRCPGLNLDDAYHIQLANIHRQTAAGAVVIGHKIGLTSTAMQSMMGVDSPDFGHLLDTMVLDHRDGPIDLSAYLSPRIEVELAFILKSALPTANCTTADVLAASAAIVPCLELIDSRIRDWKIGLLDTVADNASSAGVVLGDERFAPASFDTADRVAELRINGEIVATGSTADVIGGPAGAVAWLANAVGAFGVELQAGHVILSGSCTRAIDLRPGDVVTSHFVGTAPISVHFE